MNCRGVPSHPPRPGFLDATGEEVLLERLAGAPRWPHGSASIVSTAGPCRRSPAPRQPPAPAGAGSGSCEATSPVRRCLRRAGRGCRRQPRHRRRSPPVSPRRALSDRAARDPGDLCTRDRAGVRRRPGLRLPGPRWVRDRAGPRGGRGGSTRPGWPRRSDPGRSRPPRPCRRRCGPAADRSPWARPTRSRIRGTGQMVVAHAPSTQRPPQG